ncbi:F0F1 ATP synthase subunit B' [Minwuia thermotolerans]|uniref:ATP synthase subunit b n=1 Tax=Minwuia thermotolerans TaxID=2056226 RepID=A0A2M9FZL4_9PROT|nr:F0F1 ATP synthase subunit B' [Minwuia thermotolerans]PJK28864.1 F0F1 ATP synthase subunit B' [Minwuia thermotolerans]
MPQLAAETFASQIVWLAITFVILYLIMARVVIPRIGGILEDREQRIRSDLDKAEELKSETDKAIRDYEARLAEARSSAANIVAGMKAEMNAEIDKRRQEIEAELDQRQTEAEKQIAQQRDAALASLDDVACSVTAALVQKLSGAAPSDDRVSQAVSAAREGGR